MSPREEVASDHSCWFFIFYSTHRDMHNTRQDRTDKARVASDGKEENGNYLC